MRAQNPSGKRFRWILLSPSLSAFWTSPRSRGHDDKRDLPLGILDEAVLEVERLQEPDPHAHAHRG
eukprot:8397046-Pyramimonas_sp.AAC.1